MKIIYNKYDKRLISQLPRVIFPGRIVVIVSEQEAERAVDYLLSQPILGIDTETRPNFKKGSNHQVALMQVSDYNTCFLFRLNQLGMPSCIIRLLEDMTIPKVGLSLHDDIKMLHQRVDFTPGYFIDLQKHVCEIGIEDLSLQKIYANMFHERISKRQQKSNWEADVLSEKQENYAATDAWTCIKIYEELQRLKQSHDYKLDIVSEENFDNKVENKL